MTNTNDNVESTSNQSKDSVVGKVVKSQFLDEMKIIAMGIDKKISKPSFEDRTTNTIDSVNKLINDSKIVNDRYGNVLTSTGTDDKVKEFSHYGFSNDSLNYSLWTALYNDSWIFRRAIDKPAQDIVKLGLVIEMSDEEKKRQIEKTIKKLKSKIIDELKWGSLYGGSIGIVMFDTLQPSDYVNSISMNINKILHSKTTRMYVTDRWYGLSYDASNTVTDMNSLDYGKPDYYDITFPNGSSMRVHHDFILRYEHRNAPALIKNGSLMGWGYAEGAHLLNELQRDDELKTAVTSLINKSLIEIIKMDGMRGCFLGNDEASENQMRQRLEMVNWGRSFNSLTFLDSTDDYQMNSFSGLGGLSDLIEKNMWMISAALEMQGVLYGDLTQGFSHDSEALERYDDTIQGRADDLARPLFEKLLWILARRYEYTQTIEFEFGSLLTDQKNEKKNEQLDKLISRLSSLLSDGIIDTIKYITILDHFEKTGEVRLNFTQEDIDKAKSREQEESEDIDNLNV